MKKQLNGKKELKNVLDSLYAAYNQEQFVSTDPLCFVRGFSDHYDQEIAALLSAVLAFGKVAHIKRNLREIFDRMGDSPSHYVNAFDPARATRDFQSFVHRFVGGKEIAVLLHFVSQIYREHGTLYNFFLKGYQPDDDTIAEGLKNFVRGILALDCSPFYANGKLPRNAKVRFLLSSPEQGSACKRMNLFLRWMVRRGDGIDLGLWKKIAPAQLIIPLDTHVTRIARCLGFTKYKNNSWKMAIDVTNTLRQFDRDDPVKYDFAFSRLGILGLCASGNQKCKECPLYPFCINDSMNQTQRNELEKI